MNKKIAFVCFGEVNTPIERLEMKHDEGLEVVKGLGYEVFDGGLVIDDPEYKTADAAIAEIIDKDFAAYLLKQTKISVCFLQKSPLNGIFCHFYFFSKRSGRLSFVRFNDCSVRHFSMFA